MMRKALYTASFRLFILCLIAMSLALTAAAENIVQIGDGTWDVGWINDTVYHDRRAQLIYLGDEVGRTGEISSIAVHCSETPGRTLSDWTIRMQSTDLTHFAGSYEWIATDWTICYQQDSPRSAWPADEWITFDLETPFTYSSTDQNLMVDFCFNNSAWTYNGGVYATHVGSDPTDRRVFYYMDDSHFGDDPLAWGSEATPWGYTDTRLPNVRLGFSGDAQPSGESPEAATWLLLACTGLSGLFARRRRRTG